MVATRQDPKPNVLSDTELLAAITRDLRAIYSDVIREPLPPKLALTLHRLELQSCVSAQLRRAVGTCPTSHPDQQACPAVAVRVPQRRRQDPSSDVSQDVEARARR